MGKDSTTLLYLCRKAFFGDIPFPVIHIDTGRKFPSMYQFRDQVAEDLGLQLIVTKNQSAFVAGIGPENGRGECCTELKTHALMDCLKLNGFDSLFLAIRHDEHGVRDKERVFSPRDEQFRWNYIHQPPEFWDLYNVERGYGYAHTRVHPILNWTERDVWSYIKQEGDIPINPMYFAKDGKRYRSLGCEPCTSPIDSDADTIDKIIEELRTTQIPERSGRAQDKESTDQMQKLRALGYMVII